MRRSYIAALFGMSFRSALSLRWSFIMNAAFMVANNLIMFVNWWILFQSVDQIGGWRLSECALLWGIAASSYGATVVFFDGGRRLSRYITMGELDGFLAHPVSPLLQVLGSSTSTSGWGDIVSGILLFYWSGYLTLRAVPLILLVSLCGMAILISCAIIAQSIAFWAGDVREFSNTLWEFLIIFSTYPDPIFTGMLRFALFSILPAGFIALLPVSVVRHPELPRLLMLLCATVFYALLAGTVFRRGLRRYASGSAMQVRF